MPQLDLYIITELTLSTILILIYLMFYNTINLFIPISLTTRLSKIIKKKNEIIIIKMFKNIKKKKEIYKNIQKRKLYKILKSFYIKENLKLYK